MIYPPAARISRPTMMSRDPIFVFFGIKNLSLVKIRVQRARLWFTPEGISLSELQLLME
jgi:hypothetical protein